MKFGMEKFVLRLDTFYFLLEITTMNKGYFMDRPQRKGIKHQKWLGFNIQITFAKVSKQLSRSNNCYLSSNYNEEQQKKIKVMRKREIWKQVNIQKLIERNSS